MNGNNTHPWQILLNGTDITNDTIITENATHTFLYFTYSHSTKLVRIIRTEVIEEEEGIEWFWILIAVAVISIVVITAVLIARRGKEKKSIVRPMQ